MSSIKLVLLGFLRHTICTDEHFHHHLSLLTQTHTHARVVRRWIVQVIRFAVGQLYFGRR